jgi:tight adherence protein B
VAHIGAFLVFISIVVLSALFLPRLVQYARRKQDALFRNAEKRADELYLEIQPKKLFVACCACAAVGAGIALYVLQSPAAAAAVFILVFVVALWIAVLTRRRRMRSLEAELPGVIEKLSSALKAGSGLLGAFEKISLSTEGPFSQEVRLLLKEVQLGLPLEEALKRLAARGRSQHVSVFCTALIIALNTGGSLSSVLDNIAGAIREKRVMDGKIRALTSQGKMQGLILGAIPLALLAVLYALDPQMVLPLFETAPGRLLLAAGAVLLVLGFLFIRKVVDIRY